MSAGILGLKRRLVKGSGLTSIEGDANLDKIEGGISDLQAAASTFPTADNSTIQFVGGVLLMKDAGTTTAKLADDAVTLAKLADDSVVPGNLKTASIQVVSSAGAATLDWLTGPSFYTTLTENTTYAFSNMKDGQAVTFAVAQHASAAKTVTWPTVRWSGGVAPTMTATLSRTDVYTFLRVNGVTYGAVVANCA